MKTRKAAEPTISHDLVPDRTERPMWADYASAGLVGLEEDVPVTASGREFLSSRPCEIVRVW